MVISLFAKDVCWWSKHMIYDLKKSKCDNIYYNDITIKKYMYINDGNLKKKDYTLNDKSLNKKTRLD